MTKKNIILAIVIIILLSVAAWYFLGSSGSTSSTSSLSTTNKDVSLKATDEGVRILNTLNRVKGIDLDTEFLNSEAYKRLKESKIEIITQPVGRDNPFAPVFFDGKMINNNIGTNSTTNGKK